MSELGLLFANFLAAVWMTAVIWFVQVVQYPLFARIDWPGFGPYSEEYQQRIGWIVMGPMLLEVATAAALAVWFPGVFRSPLFAIATALIVVVWLSTFFWQVALHQRLRGGFHRETIATLVASNWLRTVGWSLRAVLLGVLIWNRLQAGS